MPSLFSFPAGRIGNVRTGTEGAVLDHMMELCVGNKKVTGEEESGYPKRWSHLFSPTLLMLEWLHDTTINCYLF